MQQDARDAQAEIQGENFAFWAPVVLVCFLLFFTKNCIFLGIICMKKGGPKQTLTFSILVLLFDEK